MNRPISPYLSVYKLQRGSLISIFYRISGVFLALSLLLYLILFSLLPCSLSFYFLYRITFFFFAASYTTSFFFFYFLVLISFSFHLSVFYWYFEEDDKYFYFTRKTTPTPHFFMFVAVPALVFLAQAFL